MYQSNCPSQRIFSCFPCSLNHSITCNEVLLSDGSIRHHLLHAFMEMDPMRSQLLKDLVSHGPQAHSNPGPESEARTAS